MYKKPTVLDISLCNSLSSFATNMELYVSKIEICAFITGSGVCVTCGISTKCVQFESLKFLVLIKCVQCGRNVKLKGYMII